MVTFRLEWDTTVVSRQKMEAIAIDADRLVEFGDGRPVGFGRFNVAVILPPTWPKNP